MYKSHNGHVMCTNWITHKNETKHAHKCNHTHGDTQIDMLLYRLRGPAPTDGCLVVISLSD